MLEICRGKGIESPCYELEACCSKVMDLEMFDLQLRNIRIKRSIIASEDRSCRIDCDSPRVPRM